MKLTCNITGNEMRVGQDGVVQFRILEIDLSRAEVKIAMLAGFPKQPTERELWVSADCIDCKIAE